MAVAPNWKDLLDAVERGDQNTVKRLVSEGLPANTVNQKGESAAHVAAKTGNMAILEYLLSEDKSLLSLKDKVGQNILYLAAVNGRTEIVQYLVENCHVDVFHVDNIRQDNSVVHVAAREGHMSLLEYFMEKMQVDVNVLNEKGESPAFLAAGNKKLPVIVYLFEKHNANLRLVDYENRNILYPAAMSGDVTVPVYVLDQKKVRLDVNWADKGGRTVLHWSALSNHFKITEYFVDVKRAEVNSPDLMKQTPLHLAAQAGHLKIVQYLYETGADPQLPDALYKTPIDVAKDKRVIQFFKDYPKRQRRSAPQPRLSDTLPNHYYSYLTNEPIPYSWMRGISADPFWSRGHLGNRSHSNLQYIATPSSGLDGFLVLANILIGGKRSMNEDQSVQSPGRVELLAADTILLNLDEALHD